MILLFSIALLGAAGVLARYGLSVWVPASESGFPLATFLINLIGSLTIAWVYIAASERQWISENLRQALQVGLLGGFTTFSAYSLESWRLVQNGQVAMAAIYGVGSPVICFLGVCIGAWFARL